MTVEIVNPDGSVSPMIPKVVNFADDPNALSATSVGVFEESVDVVKESEEDAKNKPELSSSSDNGGMEGSTGDVEEAPPVSKEEPVVDAAAKKKEEAKPEPPKEEGVVTAKDKDPVQKRIDEITKKRREAERERDYERTKREELEAQIASLKAQIPTSKRPEPEDFEDQVAYMEALVDWKVEQKLLSDKEKAVKSYQEKEEKAAVAEVYEAIDRAVDTGRDKYEDFDKVVFAEDLLLTELMAETAAGSDVAHEIFYYLGSHPDESERIAKMPAVRMVKEIGKIEERLIRASSTPEPPVVVQEPPKPEPTPKSNVLEKKLTRAPEPIVPVKTTGTVQKSLENMSIREYAAHRGVNI